MLNDFTITVIAFSVYLFDIYNVCGVIFGATLYPILEAQCMTFMHWGGPSAQPVPSQAGTPRGAGLI